MLAIVRRHFAYAACAFLAALALLRDHPAAPVTILVGGWRYALHASYLHPPADAGLGGDGKPGSPG